jgi:geranylgeranyl diphosphate synthase type I
MEGNERLDLPSSVAAYRDAINEALLDLLQDRSAPLYGMMRHQLGWEGDRLAVPGKYLRPALLLLTCQACGGDWRQAVPGAIAIELLHNFSLIHDDIQDESVLRRGRPTVWKRWSLAQAINAGDGMYALSRLTVLRLGDQGAPAERTFLAARMLDETCLALCEGQYADLAFQDRTDVTQAEYETMIGNKTAAMFRCSLEMGAIIAEGKGMRSDSLAAAGWEMGMAYQMRDDILDLWGGDETGKQAALDVRQGKKSLPVVYGLSRTATPEGRRLHQIYRQRSLSGEEIQEVIRLLEVLDAPGYCMREAERHWRRGREHLDGSGLPTDSIRSLKEAGEFLLARRF